MLRITKIFPGNPGQMSVGPCIILAMFKSYWYVCTNCDASIEVVSKGIHFQDPTCNCANSAVVWCQTGMVESDTNKRKENMETTPTVPTTYDANVLVTYKSIKNGEATYPVLKVNQLEWEMEEKQRLTDKVNKLQSQVNKIIDNMTAQYWYNPNTDSETILSDLCDILDYEPKQTVRISANVRVEIDYDIPMADVEDFDARYFVQDNLTIDSWHGDVVIDSFDVDDADVDWNA